MAPDASSGALIDVLSSLLPLPLLCPYLAVVMVAVVATGAGNSRRFAKQMVGRQAGRRERRLAGAECACALEGFPVQVKPFKGMPVNSMGFLRLNYCFSLVSSSHLVLNIQLSLSLSNSERAKFNLNFVLQALGERLS